MLKRAIVTAIGRERANRLSAPYHDWTARRRTRRFLSVLPSTNLQVNLGCGWRPLPHWINLDVAREPNVDVVWDLRKGLPFAADSCTAVFSEHVIEHLSKEDGQSLVNEIYRVLMPGGVVRVSTPDAGRYLRSYAGDGKFLSDPRFKESVDTPLDRVNIMMREYGLHHWVYDSQSLQLVLRRAGFINALEQSYGKSCHPSMQAVDSEDRAFESLYIEAVK